jgi:hypothetical protein
MLRILVVEDDPSIRMAVAEALEDMGYLVETASNGAEALAKVRADGFAAIVLDLMMPVMSGWEFLDACGPPSTHWSSSSSNSAGCPGRCPAPRPGALVQRWAHLLRARALKENDP